MKLKISQLNPNPFRDLIRCPINEEKVDFLADSMKQTGYWKNILVRCVNGVYQICYGHHRREALLKIFPADHIEDFQVEEKTDAEMIQIMANENLEDCGTTPVIIDEAIFVAKNFLENNPEEAAKYGDIKSTKKEHRHVSAVADTSITTIGARTLSRFLGPSWKEYAITESLRRLRLIGENKLDKEAVDKLPNAKSARNFVEAILAMNLPFGKQMAAVDKILADSTAKENIWNAVVSEMIDSAVISEKPIKEKKVEDLESYCLRFSARAKAFIDWHNEFERIIESLGDFEKGPQYKECIIILNNISNILKTTNYGKEKGPKTNKKKDDLLSSRKNLRLLTAG